MLCLRTLLCEPCWRLPVDRRRLSAKAQQTFWQRDEQKQFVAAICAVSLRRRAAQGREYAHASMLKVFRQLDPVQRAI